MSLSSNLGIDISKTFIAWRVNSVVSEPIWKFVTLISYLNYITNYICIIEESFRQHNPCSTGELNQIIWAPYPYIFRIFKFKFSWQKKILDNFPEFFWMDSSVIMIFLHSSDEFSQLSFHFFYFFQKFIWNTVRMLVRILRRYSKKSFQMWLHIEFYPNSDEYSISDFF